VEKLQAKKFWKHSKHNHVRNTSNKNLETFQGENIFEKLYAKILKNFKERTFWKNFNQYNLENTSSKNILKTPQSKPF